MLEIKSASEVLYSGEHNSVREALEAAIKNGADLSRADLSGANLSGACLSGADFSGADLSRADFSGAYLPGADLSRADLSRANLFGACLSEADLSEADLSGADLSGAYLSIADLSGADLFGANLFGACLSGANFSGADLSEADLSGVKGDISCSNELLAHIAIRFDPSLTLVASLILGRVVGCWADYTRAIRDLFGDVTMQRLWQAWSQDATWGVVDKMKEHEWPRPVDTCD